jgi:hypothetical protein
MGIGGSCIQQQQQLQQLGGVGDFPELAAMEQQFQQLLQQQGPDGSAAMQAGFDSGVQHAGATGGLLSSLVAERSSAAAGAAAAGVTPEDAVQYEGTGAAGMLMPSGLPASINQPRTLVPVRMSVADIETLGTNPGASPVMVAIAAADTHVRPLAVPLRPADGSDGRQQQRQGNAAAAAAAEGAPEPKALNWAERNSWFGSDTEMTQLAYQVGHLQMMLLGTAGSTVVCSAICKWDLFNGRTAFWLADHRCADVKLGSSSMSAHGTLWRTV